MKTKPKRPRHWELRLTREAIERLNETRKQVMRGRRFTVDSTELLRRAREERNPDSTTAT